MRNSDGIHSEIYKLRQKLDQQIGRLCARVLVNDLTRGDNVGGNVYIGDEGVMTLIDQPFVTSFNRIGIVSALALLNQRDKHRAA